MLRQYLENLLGFNAIDEFKLDFFNMPLYLSSAYDFKGLSIYNAKYIFALSKNDVNLKSYKVQKQKVEDLFDLPVVFVAKELNSSQRNNLIENKIEFVELGKQMFIPSLGIVLRDKCDFNAKKNVEKFTPQTQLCALFFLYSKQEEYTTKHISLVTNLNTMAISRGLSLLAELGCLAIRISGRTNYYKLKVDKKTYIEIIKKYLISPVLKRVAIEYSKFHSFETKAGYTALEEYTSIVDDYIKTYAISNKTYNVIKIDCINSAEKNLINKQYVNLEVWKYNPIIFKNHECVDKLSLYLSFGTKNDERTDEALEELMKEIING